MNRGMEVWRNGWMDGEIEWMGRKQIWGVSRDRWIVRISAWVK